MKDLTEELEFVRSCNGADDVAHFLNHETKSPLSPEYVSAAYIIDCIEDAEALGHFYVTDKAEYDPKLFHFYRAILSSAGVKFDKIKVEKLVKEYFPKDQY